MQTTYFALFALLLAGSALGRELQQTAQTSCFARGNLSILIKSGTCKGWAGASCSAFASADAVIKQQTNVAMTTALCKPVSVTAAATAIATAIARGHTSALAKITCTGSGSGCGFGVSGGSAFATAFADVAVEAAAAAINADEKLLAVCQGDIRSIAAAITTAFSTSFAQACQSGPGFASAFESDFASGLAKAIASAYIRATAKVCNLPGADTAVCRLDGSGSSTVNTNTNNGGFSSTTPSTPTSTTIAGGISGATADALPFCSKFDLVNCCANNICTGLKKIAVLNPRYDTVLANISGKSLCYCH